jgi:hypothetical protein
LTVRVFDQLGEQSGPQLIDPESTARIKSRGDRRTIRSRRIDTGDVSSALATASHRRLRHAEVDAAHASEIDERLFFRRRR